MTNAMVVIWNTSSKKITLWGRQNKSMFFFQLVLYQLPGHAIFFKFLFTVINHYHINELHLFWGSLECFCLLISSDAKYFFVSCPRHCDRGLIVVIVCYFQIWNKTEHNIIIRRVINSHLGPMYIATHSSYTLHDRRSVIIFSGLLYFIRACSFSAINRPQTYINFILHKTSMFGA